ncbi:MAG: DEAD/DEAH box helicase [Burkholderiales bacterium]
MTSATPPASPATAFAALPLPQRHMLGALAIGALPRTRSWVYEWLAAVGELNEEGRRYTQEQVRAAVAALDQQGWLIEDSRRAGYWMVAGELASAAYVDLLDRHGPASLRHSLSLADDYGRSGHYASHRWPSIEAAVSRVRLEALLGSSMAALEELRRYLPWNLELAQVLDAAVMATVDAALFERLHPSLRLSVLTQGVMHLVSGWAVTVNLDLTALATALLAEDTSPATLPLLALLAELRLHADADVSAGDIAPLLAPLQASGDAQWAASAQALLAAQAALAGRWAEAEQGFDAALGVLRKLTGKRRGLLGPLPMTLYVLSLLAQQSPAHLDKALRACLAESGKREPVPDQPFGLMAAALQMRSGQRPREPGWFAPQTHGGHVAQLDWWRWLMRAWLKEGSSPEPLPAGQADAAQRLQARLAHGGLQGLCAQLEAALRVLAGEAAPAGFFVASVQEGWQRKLDALRAVVEPEAARALRSEAKDAPVTRLLWLLRIDEQGQVLGLQPQEQSRGTRGWGKPREVPLSRLQRTAEALSPQDATLARCIRQDTNSRQWRIDLATALAALIGHPCLAFEERPSQFIALHEAGPELDVVREGELLRVRMLPTLHALSTTLRYGASVIEQREAEALRALTVLPDGPQRARLVRLTPAQQRVAQLLGPQGLEVPQQGAAQLQEVLRGLGTHFQIHADDAHAAQPAREVPAEPRLRAELTPVGDGLQLRLVAAPFGADYAADGPRLIPGRGRAHIVATLRGEALGVQRDLVRERSHLETVLDACPMLIDLPPEAPCEWTVDEPDQVLALVERLGPLNALMSLDWPQGKAVRVDNAGLGSIKLQVKSHQDWLAVQGELQVDEQLVLSLKQLIAFAGGSKSRFMPLGAGRYLALTQELRARLDDLSAVTESHKDGVRVPGLAAGWLDDALAGAQVEHDKATTERIYRLARARDLSPALPATLQATLRPYQEEGYVWAMRLAEAGLGACLADDMGLGKTLQALAVLLARAAGGPALVVAPTSLIGNWQAEARRFAPSLRVEVYAESDRAAVIAQARDHDVLLVSYQMLQQDAEAFAGKDWHTLVLDEAQAIKNAAAKRSQAVFELRSAFKLALSGTPIENRLAELWSIMRAVNPGLLGTPARFNERFAALIERQRDGQAERTLRRLIQPFILRRTKAQVLDDLPPRTELLLHVEPEPREKAHYEALRQDALAAAQKSLSGDAPGQAHLNVLAQLTKLRRAACDPRLVSPGLGWPGAKVQAFGELATELVANGHKALVFSQFVDFLALLREPLDAAGIAYQYLDGSTPAAERTRRVNAFQDGEGELFLISLKAGGFGLNLTVADYVVIADPWWNPAAEDQAAGRAHRIGQQRPVTVYRLVNQGTLEARILDLHKDKRELADSVLASDDSLPGGMVPAPEELLRLMRGEAG